jgi:hypothetical protein
MTKSDQARAMYIAKPWMTTAEIGRAIGMTQGSAWSAIHATGKLQPQRERDPLLPIAPFRSWVAGEIVRRGITSEVFSDLAGVDEARIRFWLGHSKNRKGAKNYNAANNVRLSTVDRVTVRVTGDPFVMYELYPHLQDVPDQVAA